jgi:hypothetical protein
MRVSKSLVARFGAVAAAAAIAVSGATAAADAATAAPAVQKVPTALSIANTTPVTHPHRTTAVVYGQLTSNSVPLRHLRVWLARQGAKGKWHLVRAERTGRNGYVRFRVHMRKTTTFALVFRGTRNFAKAMSPTDTITVS